MANSWFGGLVQSVKEKSLSAYELVKKDLDVYSNTVRNDTFSAVNVTSDTLKDTFQKENLRIKKGFSALIDEFSNTTTSTEDGNKVNGDDTDVTFTRTQARLHAIQLDPSTYLEDPIGGTEQFDEWVATFDAEMHKGQISELLVTNAQMRSLYTHLVPTETSHGMFWKRYFYRMHQLQQDDARKQALMNRAEKLADDSISWDDDDDESFVDLHAEIHPQSDLEQLHVLNTREINKTNKLTVTDENLTQEITRHDKIDCRLDSGDVIAPKTDSSIKNQDFDTVQNAIKTSDSFKQNFTQHTLPTDSESASTDSNLVKENNIVSDTHNDIETINKTETDITLEEINKTTMTNYESTDPMIIKTKDKGDMVVVNGSSSSSPSEATSSQYKGSGEDDWDDDLDLEVTEEDMKAAEEVAKQLTAAGINTEDDDEEWNWD